MPTCQGTQLKCQVSCQRGCSHHCGSLPALLSSSSGVHYDYSSQGSTVFFLCKKCLFHTCVLVTTRWHTREHSDPWDVAFQVRGDTALLAMGHRGEKENTDCHEARTGRKSHTGTLTKMAGITASPWQQPATIPTQRSKTKHTQYHSDG